MNYNIKHYKFNDIKTSIETVNEENAKLENLVKQVKVSEHNISMLQKNMGKYKDSHVLLKQQYYKLFQAENILFKDIFGVNQGKKALGYLPSNFFKKAGRDINYFVQFAIKNNLEFYISSRCGVESLAVYDRQMLSRILRDNTHILINSGLPLDVDKFVEFVMDKPTVNYRNNPELFMLIALAFNDSRLERIA